MKSPKPLVIGHRGASADAPENSLEAFSRARLDGADGVELDVRLCGTGDLIVFHDADLRRLADRPERVADLSWTQLQGLRLASGVKIPTLPQVFEACGLDMVINVELKTDHFWRPDLHLLIAQVKRTLERLPRLERVVLSSFNPLAVVCAAQAMPFIKRGLLFESQGPLWARAQVLAPWMSLQTIHPQNQLCTAENVSAWKRAGYEVNVWTVDDPARQQQLALWGVDGIITNKPGDLRVRLAKTP